MIALARSIGPGALLGLALLAVLVRLFQHRDRDHDPLAFHRAVQHARQHRRSRLTLVRLEPPPAGNNCTDLRPAMVGATEVLPGGAASHSEATGTSNPLKPRSQPC